jgi:hydrogenase maturation protein HypF
MGLAALARLGDDTLLSSRLPTALQAIAEEQRTAVLTMIANRFNTPLTSSCGRLFDAVAALLGIRRHSDFEGQAAMELEAAAVRGQKAEKNQETWTEEITDRDGCCIIEHRQFFLRLIRELEAGTSSDQLALTFHHWLIASLSAAIDRITDDSSIRTIVLSGGCLQNRIIMEGLFQALEPKGFQVFTGENVPVNDGGISLGQAVIGGLQYVSGNTDAGY